MGIICKIAWKTIGRYGKASLLMLCIGFLFVLTTADAYSQLYEELSSPYVLSGSVSGQAELNKYYEISSIDAATPVSVTFDHALPERWKLTKQQIYQTFLSALVLLLCSAVQMAGQNKRERHEALPQLQALCLCGLNQGQAGMLFVLRTLFTGLTCFAVGITVAMILQQISWFGALCGTICLALHFSFTRILSFLDRSD